MNESPERVLNDAHIQLVEALSGLSESDQARPLAPGKWSLWDMVAHLVYWNQMGLDIIQACFAGTRFAGFGNDIDGKNHQAAQHWSGQSMAQLFSELDQIRRNTTDFLREIGSAGLSVKCQAEDGAAGATEIGEFISSFASHQLYHCRQIKEWRQTHNL